MREQFALQVLEYAVPLGRVGLARKQTGRKGPLGFMADSKGFENVHARYCGAHATAGAM